MLLRLQVTNGEQNYIFNAALMYYSTRLLYFVFIVLCMNKWNLRNRQLQKQKSANLKVKDDVGPFRLHR